MRVLGLETSCDDTGAGLVEDGKLLAHVVASQDVHLEYGGVVPELASRAHITLLPRMVAEALAKAGLRIEDVDAVAATIGPGLVGSLLVGLEFAKGFAQARGIPFVGVNHVEAHLLSPGLEHVLPYPFLGMVASGGHTEIYHVREPGAAARLGSTRDDAAGEAFDKVGKLLGLPYPGGPHVERLAREGDPRRFRFSRPMLRRDQAPGDDDYYDVSFSGLKTALLLATRESDDLARDGASLARGFQDALIDTLVEKTLRAVRAHGRQRIVLGGGVACNRTLVAAMTERAASSGARVFAPTARLATDNAAMIARAGLF